MNFLCFFASLLLFFSSLLSSRKGRSLSYSYLLQKRETRMHSKKNEKQRLRHKKMIECFPSTPLPIVCPWIYHGNESGTATPCSRSLRGENANKHIQRGRGSRERLTPRRRCYHISFLFSRRFLSLSLFFFDVCLGAHISAVSVFSCAEPITMFVWSSELHFTCRLGDIWEHLGRLRRFEARPPGHRDAIRGGYGAIWDHWGRIVCDNHLGFWYLGPSCRKAS